MSNKKIWKKYIKLNKLKRYNEDYIYNSIWINKFLLDFIKKGLKFKSELLLYKIFYNFKKIVNPIKAYIRIMSKVKWVLITHLKRMGKYFHSIPTYLKWPKSYIHGLKNLFKVINSISSSKNFSHKLFYEMFNIKYYLYKSSCLKIKKKKFELVRENKAYTHFRWR
jgi:hypothetical protein